MDYFMTKSRDQPSRIRSVMAEPSVRVGLFIIFGTGYVFTAGSLHLSAGAMGSGFLGLVTDSVALPLVWSLPFIIPGLAIGLGIGAWLALLELYCLRPHRKWTELLVKVLLFLFGLADVFVGLGFCYVADWVANNCWLWKRAPWQNFFVYGGVIQSLSGLHRMFFVLFCVLRNKGAMRLACQNMLLSCMSMAAPALGILSYFLIEYEYLKRFTEPEMKVEAEAKAKAKAEEAAERRKMEEEDLDSLESNSSQFEQFEMGESETGSEPPGYYESRWVWRHEEEDVTM